MSMIANILTAAKEIFTASNVIKDSRGDRRARVIHYCKNAGNSVSDLAAALRLKRLPGSEFVELRDSISRCSEVMTNIANIPSLAVLLDELSAPDAEKKIHSEFNSSESKEGELKQLDEASGLFRAAAKSAHD